MTVKELIVQDVRKLITLLTGFDENDENFMRCEKFALSNIFYNQYPSVDGNSVRKSVDGIAKKFLIHGYFKASEKLSQLTEKFTNHKEFLETSSCDKWAQLSLLLLLANKPTENLAHDEPAEVCDVEKKEETFDWGAYLTEGVEPFIRPYNDESDDQISLSDDSGISATVEDTKSTDVFLSESVQTQLNVTLTTLSNESQGTTKKAILSELVYKHSEAEKWLKENIQHSWWINGDMPEVHSKFPSANLAKQWEEYASVQAKAEDILGKTLMITEYKAMREILFMLRSPTTTFLFHQENGHYTALKNVTISSLTKDSMRKYIQSMCKYFDIIHELSNFREEIYVGCVSETFPTLKKVSSYTFETYAASLHEYLMQFWKLIASLEERVKKQDDISTLYSIRAELAPKLKELDMLYQVHARATVGWREMPNWLSVTRLLSVLYITAMSETEEFQARNIQKLFLTCFRPYFDIISTWLTEGRFEDWKKEFIITRNEDVSCGSWEMWQEGFTLHPYVESLWALGIEPLPLLQGVAEKVLHTGKSFELLKQISKHAEFSQLSNTKGLLYKEFLTNILQQLPCEKEEKEIVKQHTIESQETDNNKTHAMGDRVSLDHPILAMAVSNIFDEGKENTVWHDKAKEEEEVILNQLVHRMSAGCFPLKPIVESVFTSFVEEKLGIAASLVKNILLKDYCISAQFSLVRDVFLMEGSDLEKFRSHIYQEAECRFGWANSHALTSELENCIDERYPNLSSRISVAVSENAKSVLSVDSMDDIKLNLSVEWPMTLIFSPENMKMYNSVFQFLMKVKWALWALERLRFNKLGSSDSSVSESYVRKRNLLWFLRYWMLHSVNCVHSYLMGQVLISLGLELEQDIEAATDLDTLIKVHSDYVQKVYTHCLQSSDHAFIRAAILQLVNLSLKLREVWLAGLDIVSEERLNKLGDIYIKCHWFLGTVLQEAVEASCDPHDINIIPANSQTTIEERLTGPLRYILCDISWQTSPPPPDFPLPLPPHLQVFTDNEIWEDERRPRTIPSGAMLTLFMENLFLYHLQRQEFSKPKNNDNGLHISVLKFHSLNNLNFNNLCTESEESSSFQTRFENITDKSFERYARNNFLLSVKSHSLSSLMKTKFPNMDMSVNKSYFHEKCDKIKNRQEHLKFKSCLLHTVKSETHPKMVGIVSSLSKARCKGTVCKSSIILRKTEKIFSHSESCMVNECSCNVQKLFTRVPFLVRPHSNANFSDIVSQLTGDKKNSELCKEPDDFGGCKLDLKLSIGHSRKSEETTLSPSGFMGDVRINFVSKSKCFAVAEETCRKHIIYEGSVLAPKNICSKDSYISQNLEFYSSLSTDESEKWYQKNSFDLTDTTTLTDNCNKKYVSKAKDEFRELPDTYPSVNKKGSVIKKDSFDDGYDGDAETNFSLSEQGWLCKNLSLKNQNNTENSYIDYHKDQITNNCAAQQMYEQFYLTPNVIHVNPDQELKNGTSVTILHKDENFLPNSLSDTKGIQNMQEVSPSGRLLQEKFVPILSVNFNQSLFNTGRFCDLPSSSDETTSGICLKKFVNSQNAVQTSQLIPNNKTDYTTSSNRNNATFCSKLPKLPHLTLQQKFCGKCQEKHRKVNFNDR